MDPMLYAHFSMISKLAVLYIGLGFIGGLAKSLTVNYRTFHISIILFLCLGVFTTGIAQACLCEEDCITCKSRGLQYETEVSERYKCNRCCLAAGRIPCDFGKLSDMAGSSTGNHREKGSDPTANPTVIVADHLFDNHPFPYFTRVPCDRATSRASVIYLQNQSLLL